jgi:hypothetical protein
MKNLTKDEIYSLYVNKVQVLKEVLSSWLIDEDNNIDTDTMHLDIKELDVLETVMGYKHIDEYDGDELA